MKAKQVITLDVEPELWLHPIDLATGLQFSVLSEGQKELKA